MLLDKFSETARAYSPFFQHLLSRDVCDAATFIQHTMLCDVTSRVMMSCHVMNSSHVI